MIIILPPLLGAMALRRDRSEPSGAVALVMVAPLAATQLTHNLAFLDAWRNYRDSVSASVVASSPRVVSLQTVNPPDAPSRKPASSLSAGSWGEPYLSLTLPASCRATYRDRRRIPSREAIRRFAEASQMDRVIAHADWIPAATLTELKRRMSALAGPNNPNAKPTRASGRRAAPAVQGR